MTADPVPRSWWVVETRRHKERAVQARLKKAFVEVAAGGAPAIMARVFER